MKISQYMTTQVQTIGPDAKVSEALSFLEANQFHSLPVVENGQLIGLITEDVIKEQTSSGATSLSIYELNYLLDKTVVEDIMLKDVPTTHSQTLVEEAATIMIDKNITVLPVLAETGHVEGIVSYKDIFKALVELSGYQEEGDRIEVSVKTDQVGVLSQITTILAEANISISHIFVNEVEEEIIITIQMTSKSAQSAKELLEARGYPVTVVK